MDMPSITSTLKDTGVAEISIEETEKVKVKSTKACDKEANTNRGINKRSQLKPSTVYSVSDVSIADIIIHKLPKETSVWAADGKWISVVLKDHIIKLLVRTRGFFRTYTYDKIACN